MFIRIFVISHIIFQNSCIVFSLLILLISVRFILRRIVMWLPAEIRYLTCNFISFNISMMEVSWRFRYRVITNVSVL